MSDQIYYTHNFKYHIKCEAMLSIYESNATFLFQFSEEVEVVTLDTFNGGVGSCICPCFGSTWCGGDNSFYSERNSIKISSAIKSTIFPLLILTQDGIGQRRIYDTSNFSLLSFRSKTQICHYF